MEITTSTLTFAFFSQPFLLASSLTILSLLLALLAIRSKFPKSHPSSSRATSSKRTKTCNCCCSCNGSIENSDSSSVASITGHLNGVASAVDMVAAVSDKVAERQTGASMMEQLVPEITTHALSYLDYPSLCRLSMTNSLMRKAANDDNAWKALYHKDTVTPVNGWKAYYAATRAIVNANTEFYNIIKERALPAMRRLWLNADYVKCIHASGELFSGYNAVMQSWQLAFNWDQGLDFQVRDVRARVLTDMAWVTMKTYVHMDTGPFTVTNVFEFHNGRWYMVHHHNSVMLDGDVDQQILHAF
ncbi:F-box protein SKIP8 isoform X2 [Hevea brasiliensis]|uniref:F-box protein SKIP8 isoform X2 n=1 Tax=Hevea brasiliensis TaxID=3981 RepID=UPI0025DFB515|nr:F-box protein SKIP8 isoform X2 [Hevea brasiliensis]